MEKTYDIIVGGGGIIGTAMSLAFAEHGLSVALVDETAFTVKDNSGFDGRAYALSSSTVKMLSVLGVWKELCKTAQPIFEIKVSDGIAGRGASPFFMHFHHHDMGSGPIGYMVEDRFLKSILLKKVLSKRSISKFFGSKILTQNVNANYISVGLKNKTTIISKLLVGADGRSSSIAQKSGIKRNTVDYEQTGIVCAVSHEKDHLGEAHQFFMPTGPLAILPLQKGVSSIVWTKKNSGVNHLESLSDEDFLEELAIRFGKFRGPIALKGKRYFFPLSLSIAKNLVSQRLALIGDAAHAVHPLAGQGLNLGMRDVASLAEIVTLARRCGEDYGMNEVLLRYSNWRDFDRLTLYSFTHMINKVFSNNNSILRTLRGLGMGVINNIPTVKKGLMKEASGQGKDLPILMTGRKI